MAAPLAEPRLLAARPIAAAIEPDASGLSYTRAEGYFPNRGAAAGFFQSTNIVAFRATERVLGADIDGDGDLDDSGLFVYERASETIRYTGVEFGAVRGITDRVVVFVTTEDQLGEDFNGDGIIDETPIPGIYHVETGEVTYLRLPRLRRYFYDEAWVRVGGNRLVMMMAERPEIAYYDLDTGTLTYTPVRGVLPVIAGDVIAYVSEVGTLATFNVATGESIDTGERLGVHEYPTDLELSIAGPWISFRNDERHVGRDLNGDGQLTTALGVYNTESRELQYLPAGVGSPIIAGNRSYFSARAGDAPTDAGRSVVGYYDLVTRQVTTRELPVRSTVLTAQGDDVLLLVSERSAGADLNRDGRVSDFTLAAFASLSTS